MGGSNGGIANGGTAGDDPGGSHAGGGSGGKAGSGGSGPVPDPNRPYDWVGIIGTGQSLSNGWESLAISTTQPYSNLKLQDDGPDPKYPITDSATAAWSAVPLTEPARIAVAGTGPGYSDSQYPNNIYHYEVNYGESPNSGMGNTLSAIWAASGGQGEYITAHSVVGWAGNALSNINKQGTGRAYPASLNEAKVFKRLAAEAGMTYGVGGIILTHGEGDATNPNYGTGLYAFWQDYNADIKAITGQSKDVVLLVSQQSSTAGYGNSAIQVWQAGVDHPGQIVCTGPKYEYGPYGLHMGASSYERLGQKYAEVFDLIVNRGVAWKPLGPSSVTRSGAVITIAFDVPNPPLQWDERLSAPHQSLHTAWAEGRGFEVKDDGNNELEIASVEIQDDSVILTLADAPSEGAKLTVGYAVTQDGEAAYQGGKDDGPHGQLRDSDEFVGYDRETIAVNVTQGSADVRVATAGGFKNRAPRDVVEGGDLPADTVFTNLNYDQATLSSAWTGDTGTQMLTFHHDHHNYCVHFARDVE